MREPGGTGGAGQGAIAGDPTEKIQHIVDLGVDLPVMIGEFHFGALDAGLPVTGLEGVASQRERGIAYRYYCDRVAAHSNGVGCHHFQCYDQFVLGRFDGGNYNIGLFDVCSRPYAEMVERHFDVPGVECILNYFVVVFENLL